MLGEMTLAFVGAILFWWNPSALVSVAGLFLVGFAMAPIFPGWSQAPVSVFGAHHAANTIGIQLSAASLGGALLPSLAGVLAQRRLIGDNSSHAFCLTAWIACALLDFDASEKG